MPGSTLWTVFDLFGVFVFALSGGLAAARKRMDLFGFVVVSLLPAVGGGTLRDIVLGAPVFWVQNTAAIWVTIAAAVLTFLFAERLARAASPVAWCDAVGLSVFCVLGAGKALDYSGSPTIAVMMGVTTAVMGGLIRDVVCDEPPLILHREIYATAAFFGAAIFTAAVTLGVDGAIALWVGAGACFLLRGAGIRFGLSLPRPRLS